MAEAPNQEQLRCQEHNIRMDHLEREMERLRHELLGNGQPGKLDRMNARNMAAMVEFKATLAEFKTSMVEIERKVGRIMVVIAVLGAGAGAGGAKVVMTLMGTV